MEFKLRKMNPTFNLVADEGRFTACVEQIGKGTFCTAYRNLSMPETVYLVVNDDDHSKEIAATCDSPHIPKLTRIGDIGDSCVWQTKYYRRLTAGDTYAWKQYRLLQCVADEIRRNHLTWGQREGYARHSWGYDAMCAIHNRYAELGDSDITDALRQLADSACNYGQSWLFEFAPRNLAVDECGRLILLDCLFDMEVIDARYQAVAKRRGVRL